MADKPNLLFLFTDEQRADTMAAYGNDAIRTPNLNRLADEGICFENTYVSQAVCTPSRSTIMTGLYPHTNGCVANNVPLSNEVPTLVERGDFDDYRTGYNGKWHLGDEVFCQHGFDEWVSTEDMYRPHFGPDRDPGAPSSYHKWLVSKGIEPPDKDANGYPKFDRGTVADFPEDLSKPTFQADEACRFLRENEHNPFALYVNFLEPHMPFTGPCDDVHALEEVELSGNLEDPVPETDSKRMQQLREVFLGDDAPSEMQWRRLIANYWGLVHQVDKACGRILSTLEECGLKEDTIVVFTSDHGDMMGSHGLVTKCVDYEEAVRVPLIMRIPAHSRNGSVVPRPFSQVDLVPTLLDLMEQDVPTDLEGQSWRPVLGDQGAPEVEDVVIEWTDPDGRAEECRRTVVSPDGWKLILRGNGQHQLFHLRDDPLETNNLYGEAQTGEIASDLRYRIKAWQDRTEDEFDLPPV